MPGTFPRQYFLLAENWQVRRLAGGGAAVFGGLGAEDPQAAKPIGPGEARAGCARAARPPPPPAGQAPDLPQDEKAARGYAPGRWMPVEKRRAAPQSWGKSLI